MSPTELKRGFTLLELVLVIGVIGILASLLLPALGRAKAAARSTACLSNLHQIGIGLQLYISDNENRLPAMFDWSTDTASNTNGPPISRVLSKHLGSSNVFRCPADRIGAFEATGSSYAWNVLLNGQDADHPQALGMQFNTHQIPLVFDKEAFHRVLGKARAVNYLYADQHIKNLLEMPGGSAR